MSTALQLVSALLEDLEARLPHIRKEFPSVTNQEISQAAAADPTGSDYVQWILRLASKKIVRFPEDTDKIRQRLEQFASLKRKPGFQGERDINRYKSYGELATVVDANLGVKTKGEVVRHLQMTGCRHLKTTGDYALYEVTTPEAAAKLFRETEWCVKDPKYFIAYSPQRYYFVTKNSEPFALWHPESSQLKDTQDVDYKTVPEVLKKLLPHPDPKTCSAETAYKYAYTIVGGQWHEGEAAIAKDAHSAYSYALNIVKGRWPKGEAAIAKDAHSAYCYALNVVKGRWPKGEAAIAKDAYWANNYALKIVKGKFP